MTTTLLSRRRLIAGLAAGAALPLFHTGSARASDRWATGPDFGLVPDSAADQSPQLQTAVDRASALGVPLLLAGGRYRAANIKLPSGITIAGVGGRTVLEGGGTLLLAQGQPDVTIENLVLQGARGGEEPLVAFGECTRLRLSGLRLEGGGGSGIVLEGCGGVVAGCDVSGFEDAAIFARHSRDLIIRDCRVSACGNGGILVWGDGQAHDGTIVTGNRISDIDWRGGGNGQNGNGINVFRANGVIVADNVIRNCAFTAVRLNASRDTQVTGNNCFDSGEVAIFSEFGFSGSVIANNIVDGAAQGISMTNFDTEGRLATCTGNIVRNIGPRSLVNPDTTPAGIFAEADAVVAGNVVEAVPGIGIGAGWGPYLRDVAVTGNVVRDCEIGIAVSVAEGAGKAVITGNRVAGARRAGIAALAWDEIISADLTRDFGAFPNLNINANSVG